ncbi:unnamed protein product [Dicrocoelium dendriticum]|nr:unnamed protein product [Dicrocoelium dendriticum]
MCLRCCHDPKDSTITSFGIVEDGDLMQDIGMNRTLALLQDLMNQTRGPVVVDQPPPPYCDFAKYQLVSESVDRSETSEVTNRYPTIPVIAQQNVSTAGGLNVDQQSDRWTEPFPKPPGEPPPALHNWFLTRLASIRRSLMAHFFQHTTQGRLNDAERVTSAEPRDFVVDSPTQVYLDSGPQPVEPHHTVITSSLTRLDPSDASADATLSACSPQYQFRVPQATSPTSVFPPEYPRVLSVLRRTRSSEDMNTVSSHSQLSGWRLLSR